jgi:hypothetical protein
MQNATTRKALATTRFVVIAIVLKLAVTAIAALLLADMHRLATAPL